MPRLIIQELRQAGRTAEGRLKFLNAGNRFVWDDDNRGIPADLQLPIAQRTSRDDYAGSEEPSEQILGWNYESMTISGMWDDRYGGPGWAYDQMRAMEATVKRGRFVRLEYTLITRVGVITRFLPVVMEEATRSGIVTPSKISYQITISPHQANDRDSVRTSPKDQKSHLRSPEEAIAEVRAILDTMTAYQDAAPELSMAEEYLATVGSALDAMESEISAATTAINDRLAVVESVLDPLQRVKQAFSAVRSAAQDVVETVATVRDEALGVFTAITVLEFEVWRRGLVTQSLKMLWSAEQANRDIESQADPDVLTVYRAAKGEHLYKISSMFYGNPGDWRLIARRNELTNLVFQEGTTIIIPRRRV